VAAEIEESAGRRECGYPGSAPRAYEHPADRGALAASRAVPERSRALRERPGSASAVLRSLVSGESGETEGFTRHQPGGAPHQQ
jgi:hypothetical protein